MPELPEVEVTRLALAPHAQGARVLGVEVRDGRLRWPVPPDLHRTLAGQRIERLRRRGKYLLWEFAHGWLLSHLGMSGRWRILTAPVPVPGPHDHVDLRLDGGICLRLTDPRRFGALLWHPASDGPVDTHPLLSGLGIEPFDPGFTGTWLHEAMRGRRAPIKQVLLAGDVVVGVGNIYASESLFQARIHPATPAAQIGLLRCERLAAAVREVLERAIATGGSTLRDFIGADGAQGYFTAAAFVYGRTAQPCLRCGQPIRRLLQGQRSTWWCPHCQRR